ncbi:MAG: zinc dependent phospholipase C family protein, partial [Candidatus Solibacter sp.]|nr:zinc dependent phospholipase C family protein [Candidatus Solibacter sp.]
MPAVLTHKTIMLLARQRLQEIEETLKVKRLAAATPRSNIENAVQALAAKALSYLNSAPPPSTDFPGAPYAQPLGSGVSKFAVMGAMGPDITGFSNALAPGQAWPFDNVHKGYPDEDREAVVASTCDLIFQLWRKVSLAITSEVPAVDPQNPLLNPRDAQLNMMRAYVLGHLCHVAGDVISHPLIHEIEWRSATSARSKLEHGDGEHSHDALVARQVLLRDSTRAGAAWDAWWPTLKEVPPQFFAAYSDALEQTYTAVTARRVGLAEFEERLAPLGPPTPTADFIKDGYSLYRSGVISMAYHYTTWNWFAFLLPVWAPIMTVPLLGGAFEISREFFMERPAGVKNADSWSGLLSLGFALGSAAALTYSIWLATLTMRGVEAQAIYGIVGNSLSTVLGIVFFFTLLSNHVSAAVRFGLFVGVPALVALVQLVMWIVFEAKSGSGRRAKLALALAAMLLGPVIAALLAALLFWGLRGGDGKLEPGWFLLASGIWLLAWGA